MGAGANAGGFAAGFGKGLSNALLRNRERSDQKTRDEQSRKDRLFQSLLPTMLENVEDPADLEPFLAQQFPEQFGTPGKGAGRKGQSPFDNIKRFIGPLIGMRGKQPMADDLPEQGGFGGNLGRDGGFRSDRPMQRAMPPSAQPPGVTGGTLDFLQGTQQPGQTLTPTTRDITDPSEAARIIGTPVGGSTATSSTAGIGAPSSPTGAPGRRTLMGVPIMSAEEKAQRQVRSQTATTEAQIAARRKIAAGMGLTPEQTTFYVINGELPTTGRATESGFTLNPGDVRFDAAGKQVAAVPATSTSSANQPTNFDAAILAADRGGNAAEVARLTELKSKAAAAGRAPTAAGEDISAFASMVADNPAMLQGVTPTVASNVMQALAKSPALRARYEAVRMEPIRQTTENVVKTLDQLLTTDPKTGKVTGLSNGAKWLYGKSNLLGQQFVAGSDAANAKAALENVTGQLALDLIAQMKAQSKTGATGFGQLNAKELALLESSASILKGNISEELALEKLKDLRERYQKILQPSLQEASDQKKGAGGAAGAPGAPTGPVWKDGKLYVNGHPLN